MSRARLAFSFEHFSDEDTDDVNPHTDDHESKEDHPSTGTVPSTRRVSTKRSPQIKVFHECHRLRITLDSGAKLA